MSNVLLGASWCAPCKMVKQFLDNRGVDYEFLDLDTEDGMALAQERGIRSVPTMVIDNETILIGDKPIKEAFDD